MWFVTMSVFNRVNGIPRLCETFTAATNWPRFRKPLAAFTTFVPDGSRDCSLFASCVFDCTFSCTGDSVVPEVGVVFDEVGVFVVGAVVVFVAGVVDVVLVVVVVVVVGVACEAGGAAWA
jgi:hypothetical protein